MNTGLGGKVGNVTGVYAAAIQQVNVGGDIAKQVSQAKLDGPTHYFRRNLRCSCLARANGPDRFVRDHKATYVKCTRAFQPCPDLGGYDLCRSAGLPLLQGLSHAQNWSQPVRQSCQNLPVHEGIRFSE